MMVGASTNVIANLGGLGLKSESDSGKEGTVVFIGGGGLGRVTGAVRSVDIAFCRNMLCYRNLRMC